MDSNGGLNYNEPNNSDNDDNDPLNQLIQKMKRKCSMLNNSFLVQAFKKKKYFNIPLILSISPLFNLTYQNHSIELMSR